MTNNTNITFEDVVSFESLLDSANQCCKGVMWKSSTQMFALNKMRWCSDLHHALINDKYKSKGFTQFFINERGKTRFIQAVHISERCVQKSLVKNALRPIIVPRLIYDNSASLKGKGTEFALKRLKQHLAHHYRKYGRKGGILLIDFHDYFGSINHAKLISMFNDVIKDKRIVKLIAYFINAFDGDCGLGLGSEVSQIGAIFYPNKIDHYIKEQLHIKGYGRYMDDSYLISDDIDYLRYCLTVIRKMCEELNITLNEKKTHIVKLNSGGFEFLKKRIFISDTGKIVMRLMRKNITKRRQLIKKHIELYYKGQITFQSLCQSYDSWVGYASHYNAYKTILSMDKLFIDLFRKGNT